jgi:ADP-heptose:LPS heptosyltransferase
MFPQTTFNSCGEFNLNQSASVIKQSEKVITSDTGLMHIASAYKKEIISLWGNTIPEFGMYPYLPGSKSRILEVKNLSCRPCSKLGHKKCPKGHFKCMNDIEISEI